MTRGDIHLSSWYRARSWPGALKTFQYHESLAYCPRSPESMLNICQHNSSFFHSAWSSSHIQQDPNRSISGFLDGTSCVISHCHLKLSSQALDGVIAVAVLLYKYSLSTALFPLNFCYRYPNHYVRHQSSCGRSICAALSFVANTLLPRFERTIKSVTGNDSYKQYCNKLDTYQSDALWRRSSWATLINSWCTEQ